MPRIKPPTPQTRGSKAREYREEKFIRIAKRRMDRILREITLLKRCSKRNLYGYTQDQIDAIQYTLTRQVEELIAAFAAPPDKEVPPTFDFGKAKTQLPL